MFTYYINLIFNYRPFNKWPGSEYECTTRQRVVEFNDYLNSHGLRSTIRWSRGGGKELFEDIYLYFNILFVDILAACGQLRSNEELKTSIA